ncbi:MAG: branched-chain amino acid ABC transporter permease [Rhizobiales bacterium]|nr:branched-chain amino acid ABC transporter permease [Hyphomicrobiales bacterium]
MDQAYGIGLYVISLLTFGGIYAVMALGLNVQWGFTGMFNAGIAGFFAIGAYTGAILTTAESARHLGGFGLPVVIGLVAAMITSGMVAWAVAKICIRLRSDYLAIATLGIAEIFRLILKNETWATNGPRGVSLIPKPFETLAGPWNHVAFMALVLVIVFAIYLLLERARKAPWGRLMTAIRENEAATRAAGKDVDRLRIEAFVLGSMLMGLGGALTAHYLKFIDPNAADPLTATFLVWVMLICGGSANNKGAILGAILIWTIWSATELLTSRLPDELAIRTAYIRIFLIGLLLQIVLQRFPNGILPEKRERAAKAGQETRSQT